MKRYRFLDVVLENEEDDNLFQLDKDYIDADEAETEFAKMNEMLNDAIGRELNYKHDLDEKDEEIARLRKALKFYAEQTWSISHQIAREALAEKDKEK